ncbi:MAG: hypothetical protein WC841_01840 [Candidatus Shapirobacteria bacterium]|jgi:hypothetical protein
MLKNLKILRPVLALLILFIPLYPKFPLSSVKGTYVAIRLDDIIVSIAIVIWVIYQLKHRLPIIKLKISQLFIAYFLAIIASTINAILVYQTDPINILVLHLIRRFEYMALFFITIDAIKTKKDLLFPYIFLLVATVSVTVYGYGQKYLEFPVVSTMNSEFSKGQLLQMDIWTRINSTFAGHYDLAAYLSVVLIIIGCAFVISKNKYLKIASLLAWLPAFQIFTFTASRISTFSFWGAIVLTLFLIRKYLWIIPVSAIVIFSIMNSKDLNQRLLATIPSIAGIFQAKATVTPLPTITIAAPTPQVIVTVIPTPTIIIVATPIPTIFRHPPIDEFIPVDSDVGVVRSGEIRFNAEWPRAISAYSKNYLVGTGLGSITLATDNDYLRLLGESGLLGFISFMAIIVYFIVRSIPSVFRKQQTTLDIINLILLGGLIATLANAMFIDVFEASKTAYTFWIMMGIFYQSLALNVKKS